MADSNIRYKCLRIYPMELQARGVVHPFVSIDSSQPTAVSTPCNPCLDTSSPSDSIFLAKILRGPVSRLAIICPILRETTWACVGETFREESMGDTKLGLILHRHLYEGLNEGPVSQLACVYALRSAVLREVAFFTAVS